MVFSINFLLAGLRICFYVWFSSIGLDYWYLEFLVGVSLYLVYLWFTIPRVHRVVVLTLGDSAEIGPKNNMGEAYITDYLVAAKSIMNEVLAIPMTVIILVTFIKFLNNY